MSAASPGRSNRYRVRGTQSWEPDSRTVTHRRFVTDFGTAMKERVEPSRHPHEGVCRLGILHLLPFSWGVLGIKYQVRSTAF